MTRLAIPATIAFLAGALALTGIACESRHVDRNFGTEAGTDFDAPARETPTDGGAGAADAGDDGGV